MDSTPRSSANKLIAVSIRNVDELGTDVRDKESPAGPAESPTATNMELIITPTSATSSTATGLATRVLKDGDTGRGGGGNYAATWGEFSNGRSGHVNSPAFGSQDLWGGFGHIVRALPSVLQSSSKNRSHRSHRWAHVIVRLRISRRRVCASSVAKSHRTHSPLRLFPASLSASFRTSSAWPRTDGGPWDPSLHLTASNRTTVSSAGVLRVDTLSKIVCGVLR